MLSYCSKHKWNDSSLLSENQWNNTSPPLLSEKGWNRRPHPLLSKNDWNDPFLLSENVLVGLVFSCQRRDGMVVLILSSQRMNRITHLSTQKMKGVVLLIFSFPRRNRMVVIILSFPKMNGITLSPQRMENATSHQNCVFSIRKGFKIK